MTLAVIFFCYVLCVCLCRETTKTDQMKHDGRYCSVVAFAPSVLSTNAHFLYVFEWNNVPQFNAQNQWVASSLAFI